MFSNVFSKTKSLEPYPITVPTPYINIKSYYKIYVLSVYVFVRNTVNGVRTHKVIRFVRETP